MEDKSIIEKLQYIQQELKAPKNQYNSFGKYYFRSCEDILEAIKPLLKETQMILRLQDELQQIGDRYYVKATAMLTDKNGTISNSAFAREEDTKKGMDGSQITGASSSYARKYALNGLFLIDDVKDSDTTNAGEEVTKEFAESYVFNFGKHSGEKLVDVIESDNSYITWLLKNEKTDNAILKSIEILTGQKPIEIDLEVSKEFQRVLVDSETDLEELLQYFNKENKENFTSKDLTKEQKVEAIGIMKKKIEKRKKDE